MGSEFDKETVTKAYARWAPVYDLVFGRVFEPGRRAVIAASEHIGGRILEVGVGTGLSLPCYASTSRVFGIDLSEPMALGGAALRSANVERGIIAQRDGYDRCPSVLFVFVPV